MKKLSVLVVCLAAWLVYETQSDAHESEREGARPLSSLPSSSGELRALGYLDEWTVMFWRDAPAMAGGVPFCFSYKVAGSREVYIRQEEEFADGSYDSRVQSHGTTFDITSIESTRPDSVVISGIPPRGGVVIERWVLTPPTGSLVLRAPVSLGSVAVGMALPTGVPSSSQVVGGGSQVALEHRGSSLARVVREEVFFDASSATPLRLAAEDPEGRFFVTIDANHTFRQVDLVNDTLLNEVSVATYPLLANVVAIEFVDHQLHGRILFFTATDDQGNVAAADMLMAVDTANNGLFDSFDRYTKDYLMQHGYLDSLSWDVSY